MPAQALATAPIPPQNLDAEESVLGAMMLSPLAIGAVTESTSLSASDFYRESHGLIYRAIITLYGKGEPVDAITVVDELDRMSSLTDIGGAERVHELATLGYVEDREHEIHGASEPYRLPELEVDWLAPVLLTLEHSHVDPLELRRLRERRAVLGDAGAPHDYARVRPNVQCVLVSSARVDRAG